MAEVVEEEFQLAANATATATATEQKFVVPFRHRRRYSLYLVQPRIGGGAAGRVPSRYVLFDTGSDLSWTQCVPCQRCNRGYYLPLNAIKSGTYRHLSCEDPLCEHGTGTQCSMNYVSPGATDDLCLFRRSYGDGSKVSGYVVSDIFRFSNSIVGAGDEIALVRVSDPTSNPNINCYFGDMSDVEAVSVTLGFNGGAELELFGDTLFSEASAGRYVCLGVAGGEQAALGMIARRSTNVGMIAQRSTNVGYDLSNGEISFDRHACA